MVIMSSFFGLWCFLIGRDNEPVIVPFFSSIVSVHFSYGSCVDLLLQSKRCTLGGLLCTETLSEGVYEKLELVKLGPIGLRLDLGG